MPQEKLFIFLRAVNLGRVNKVPMRQLLAEIDEAGLGKAGFLLQSGNLIFPEAPAVVAKLKEALEELIQARFHVATKAMARTSAQLLELLAANPFDLPEGGSIQVAMWDEQPDALGLAALASGDYEPDRLHLTEREAIICYPNNSQGSKLNNAMIERKLGVPATLRNARTLRRLLETDDHGSHLEGW